MKNCFALIGLCLCLASAVVSGAATRPPLGSWLMDLQLGQPEMDVPSELTAEQKAELKTAPPDIRAMFEKNRKHTIALEKLRHLGTNAVPPLLGLLRHSMGLHVKQQALVAIDHLQPPPGLVLGALTDYLNTGELAENTALVLARQGPTAVAPLLASLTNRNDSVREAIVWHLMDFHPDENGHLRISVNGDDRVWPHFESQAAVISPAVLKCLDDTNPVIRYHAAICLQKVGGDPATVVPALIRHMTDGNPIVRGDAISALEPFGPTARTALPFVRKSLNDPDQNVRFAARMLLRAWHESENPGPPKNH